MVENVTQSLLKNDNLMPRFGSFNDKLDSYQTRKANFTSIVKESKRFARSIRGSNISDRVKELCRIWKRLDDRYGRPEMNKYALKNKLNRFPQISMINPKMLYDLLDILTEIESATENEKYATLLSYYDSSSGVSPISSKLP